MIKQLSSIIVILEHVPEEWVHEGGGLKGLHWEVWHQNRANKQHEALDCKSTSSDFNAAVSDSFEKLMFYP